MVLLSVLIHEVRPYWNLTKSVSILVLWNCYLIGVFDNFLDSLYFHPRIRGNFVKNRSILYSGSLKLFKFQFLSISR